MGKRILVIVLLLMLTGFAYVGYNSYDAKRAGASGDVFPNDSVEGRTKGERALPGSSAGGASKPQRVTDSSASAQSAAGSEEPAPMPAPSGASVAAGGDTISPNPPNGMVFSGTGHYQLYRQGDLTWRVNTDTGQSCILFATDEEWKKPKVLRAGCGGR